MTLSQQNTIPVDAVQIDGRPQQTAELPTLTALTPEHREPLDAEQLQRAACYGLIAAVLRQAPDDAVLDYIGQLSTEPPPQGADELLLSMSALGMAARLHNPAALDDEFHDLFIGLGRGEVVPYGSWYLTGFLQEKPLSDLRTDLGLLGFSRSEDTYEPEDHVAALCEVMQMMISEGRAVEIQRAFIEKHMLPWMERFFDDLGTAQSAVFYRSVARFAGAFLRFEHEYLSMQS